LILLSSGSVFAIPNLLKVKGLKMDGIGFWELNEAFAVQAVYCRAQLSIPNEKLNINSDAISIAPPLRHECRA
jgi:acetyl-CoA C-acetyltransferase